MGEDRLEALGEGKMNVPLIELIVMWSEGFLVRDIGWEYMALERLAGAFFDSCVHGVTGWFDGLPFGCL